MYRWLRETFAAELQRLRRLDCILFYLYYRFTKKVDPRQILILSESRESLSGNLEFIDRAIDKSAYKVVYSLKGSILKERRIGEKRELCRQLALSKYILVDDFIPVMYPIPLRKETRFIQVWHAMGAFKQVGFSRLGKPGGPSKRSLSHRNYTDTIVSSEAIRGNYAEAFGILEERVHAIGVPRTDIFFDADYRTSVRESLYEKYPQFRGKKVILFAPTFRGHGRKTAYYDESFLDFEKMERELKEDYVCIIKMHPFIQKIPPYPKDSGFFANLSDEREINDLLFITDVLVTDYSSVIFEASLLDLHTVFFVPDLREYTEERDFYYPFEEYVYGPVAADTEELIQAVRTGASDEEKLKVFKEKFCGSCDGRSTQRFVEYFFGEMKNESTDKGRDRNS